MNCSFCNTEFNKTNKLRVCSPKCKLLESITKKSKVRRKGWAWCWIWSGTKTIKIDGKVYTPRKASYLVFNGQIPLGKWIYSNCRKHKCINPGHLCLVVPNKQSYGQVSDNLSKSRFRTKQNNCSKLTDAQINDIKQLRKAGFTYKQLISMFNCSHTQIWDVIKGN